MKTNLFTKSIALLPAACWLLGLSANAVFAQQNLIVNGSFEAAAGIRNFPGWDLVGPADNNSDFGVATSSTFPDVAELGTNYAFFHGNPTDGSQDCLGQTVYLTLGAPYTITFYLGTDGTTLGSGAAMWAVIGTSFGIDYSQDISLTAYWPNSSNALPYQKFTTTCIATNAIEMLSFHGIDATSSILLDNVSMTPAIPQLNVSPSPEQHPGVHLDLLDQRVPAPGRHERWRHQLGDSDEHSRDRQRHQPGRHASARQQSFLPTHAAIKRSTGFHPAFFGS